MNSANREIRCDGCGALATAEHLRRRVERLEWATRFRPVHIRVLLLHPAPPTRMPDYFYHPAKSPGARSREAQRFFDGLASSAGLPVDARADEEQILEQFQRRGLFLAACSECPMDEAGVGEEELADRFADSVLGRVRFSYHPKHIVLLSSSLEPWIARFRDAGLADKLLLDRGKPFALALGEEGAAQGSLPDRLRERLMRASEPGIAAEKL